MKLKEKNLGRTTQSGVQALGQGRYDLARLELLAAHSHFTHTKQEKVKSAVWLIKELMKFMSNKALLMTNSCGYSTSTLCFWVGFFFALCFFLIGKHAKIGCTNEWNGSTYLRARWAFVLKTSEREREDETSFFVWDLGQSSVLQRWVFLRGSVLHTVPTESVSGQAVRQIQIEYPHAHCLL